MEDPQSKAKYCFKGSSLDLLRKEPDSFVQGYTKIKPCTKPPAALQKKLTSYRIVLTILVFLALVIIGIFVNDSLQDETVYVTRTGYCYHVKSCGTYSGGKSVSIRKAEKDGYTPCSLCNPWHNRLFFVLLWYAILSSFAHTAFLAVQMLIENKVKRENEARLREYARAFCQRYNQRKANELFGMPEYYCVGSDFIPVLISPYDDEYGVYAGATAYHLRSCQYAKGDCISKYHATELDLRPCKLCKPPAPNEKWYIRYSHWAKRAASLGVFVEIRNDIITVLPNKEAPK